MTNQPLNAVTRIGQLVWELRTTIKKLNRAAESALAHAIYDIDLLALHEERIASLQDQMDELVVSLLSEDQRVDFWRSVRWIKIMGA